MFNHALEKAKLRSNHLQIFFVTNVSGKTIPDDYLDISDSILTEFFTEEEYNQILSAIKLNYPDITAFFDENQFIKFVLDNQNTLDKDNIVVFNLARNGKGLNKKSLIPSFCEKHRLKYTGSDAYTTCIGRNKFHHNALLANQNINVAKSWFYKSPNWLHNNKPPLNTKIILKPAYESASRGVNENSIIEFNNSEEQNILLNKLSQTFEQIIVAQEFISGYEVQVPIIVIDNTFIPLEIVAIYLDDTALLGDEIITFEHAFDETYTFDEFNIFTDKIRNEILNQSSKAAEILGIRNYGRIDFRVSENGDFYITDISTHPYLIEHSSFQYRFTQMGYSFEDLFLLLIGIADDNK